MYLIASNFRRRLLFRSRNSLKFGVAKYRRFISCSQAYVTQKRIECEESNVELVQYSHNQYFLYSQVARVSEEAAGTIAKSLPPEICLQALSPVLREAEFPVNLAALKMTIKVWLGEIICSLF